MMRDGHQWRINIAMHGVNLLQSYTALERSTSYQARQKTKKFGTVKFDQRLAENIVNPTQTEWAALIDCTYKERNYPVLCWFPKRNVVKK